MTESATVPPVSDPRSDADARTDPLADAGSEVRPPDSASGAKGGFDGLEPLLERARAASRRLARASARERADALLASADALLASADAILAANACDVAAEEARGTSAALVDRLRLTPERLDAIAGAAREVAGLPDPLGRVLDGWTLPNGLRLARTTVPFGVIAMIYESRPNVTVDAAALTLRAGSAAVLRGSSNALASNRAITAALRGALEGFGLRDAVQLVDSPDRALVTGLLEARGRVDLAIPRGGAGLIRHVVETARVPVIETGVGNCHVLVDASADLDMAERIVANAKTQRPGVCNALETLLVHRDAADAFLPRVLPLLAERGVEIRGDERVRALHPGALPAREEDWAEEFLDLVLAVRVVEGLDEGLEHIARYGSGHSEAIVTRDRASARRFTDEVDAAAVYVNASTRFTDGFEFGFGAEIGISTQKLHARGPMGLAEMVTSKYVIEGEGQIRE